jgi:hypothetical protein
MYRARGQAVSGIVCNRTRKIWPPIGLESHTFCYSSRCPKPFYNVIWRMLQLERRTIDKFCFIFNKIFTTKLTWHTNSTSNFFYYSSIKRIIVKLDLFDHQSFIFFDQFWQIKCMFNRNYLLKIKTKCLWRRNKLKLTIIIIPAIERIVNRKILANISKVDTDVGVIKKIVTKKINRTAIVAITSRSATNQANC